MYTLNFVKKNTYNRNNKIFKQLYNKNTLSKKISIFKINPYSRIKTILMLEIASIFIFLLLKTKISANAVTIFGFFWILLGVILTLSNDNLFFYLGILIIYLKIIPDYVDGQLASLRNTTSNLGHELDSWAGVLGARMTMSAFFFYAINNNPAGNLNFFYIILFLTLIFSFADPRLFLSKFKKTHYMKHLHAHKKILFIKKNVEKKNLYKYLFNLAKFFHYDGSSKYTDLLIFLILIEKNILNYEVFYIIPGIWSITYLLVFVRSISLTLKK